MILTATALDVVRSYMGVKEEGENSGPIVDEFLRSVGLGPGYSWCSAFLFFCFERAARQLGLTNPYPKTASSLRVWRFAEPICRDPNPGPGFVYVLRHSDTTGHVGIVESVTDGVITSISGNTFDSSKGGRQGNCVARHIGQPEVVHGGELLGYLNFDLAAQAPSVA